MSRSAYARGVATPGTGRAAPYSGRNSRPAKESWCGNNIGNAFKLHLSHYIRTAAAGVFYARLSRVQKAAAKLAGQNTGRDFTPKARPQLTPVYTTYPPGLAALAAIGLTAFLEYKAWSQSSALETRLGLVLAPALLRKHGRLKAEPLQKMSTIVTNIVQARILSQDLCRQADLSSVENYRLFMASMQSMSFPSVVSIVNYVVLYGDVLPDWGPYDLHPQTRSLLEDLDRASKPYFRELESARPEDYMRLGEGWARALMDRLVRCLPDKTADEPKSADGEPPATSGAGKFAQDPGCSHRRFAPPGGKHPPSLFDPPPLGARLWAPGFAHDHFGLLSQLLAEPRFFRRGPHPGGIDAAEFPGVDASDVPAWKNFKRALAAAAMQDRSWEDTRTDIAEQLCKSFAFGEGPITGQRVDGHEVQMDLGGECVGGQLFDKPIEIKLGTATDTKLLAESDALYRRMSRLVFPSREPVSSATRFVTSGALDPARLPIAGCSDSVYKRYRLDELDDRRGRPVVLLVNDASGSVGAAQMRLMKLLSMAWIRTSLKNNVRILAGMYNQGRSPVGVSGPLVQWLYHPEKTPALSAGDTLRSIAAMPDKGSGEQADAISLQFMLDEAVRIARGRSIYLTLMGDFKWCRSFPGRLPISAAESDIAEYEVRTFFENAYKRLRERLHVTLVGLNARAPQRYESLVDKVITVPEDKLNDSPAVAEQIGAYVAQCIRERKKARSN